MPLTFSPTINPLKYKPNGLHLASIPYHQKNISDDAKSLNLTAPTNTNDNNYMVLSAIDTNLSNLKILANKKYHPLVAVKDGANYFLKFKLYLNTGLFDREKNRISITSLLDFHKYLREGTTIKIIFSFSKMWSMGKDYGFSMSVRRILLKDEVKVIPEPSLSFLDSE